MMQTNLPRSQAKTTRLGFGCAYLVGGIELPESRRLVDEAYDIGYRHFDVAPMYGMGMAEDVLGAALARRRAEVTIATKVGIARNIPSLPRQIAHKITSSIRAIVPQSIRKTYGKVVGGNALRGQFDLPAVEASLADSLRRLRTDYVDILLLHEVAAEDLTDDLLTFLDKARQSGVICAVGVASSAVDHDLIRARHGAFFDVLQYSWSLADDNWQDIPESEFHITHRAIMNAFGPLKARFSRTPADLQLLSSIAGMDLSRDDNLSNALLGAALARNPRGLVLAASRQKKRIVSNGLLLHDDAYERAGAKLLAWARTQEKVPA